MRYKDACLEVGFNPDNYNPPDKVFTYYGYKLGECIQFPTLDKARTYSRLTDYIVSNQEEIDKYNAERRALELKGIELWHKDLREKYKHLTDDIYNACYSKAYEDHHYAGYDEVANGMVDIVEFAENILKTK